MPRRINQPITLHQPPSLFSPSAPPTRFNWRGRDYPITSLSNEWRSLGRWWKGEAERRYLRALTPTGQAFDLCQDMKTGTWTLVELQD